MTTTRSWRRRLVFAAGLVGALLLAAYVAGYFLTGARLPASTTIAGVDVGGMSPAKAVSAVERGVADRVDEPIVAVHDEQTYELDPNDLGLALDAQASVAAAGGERTWNPVAMLRLCCGDHEVDPVLDIDTDALESAVASIADEIDVPVVEPLITFPEGEPKARQPQAGEVVPQERLAQLLSAAYLTTDDPVEIPTESKEPTVDAAGLAAAMTSIAEPAVSAPVTIKVGGQSVDLPVTAYSPALSVQVKDGAMTAVLDADDLAKPLTSSTTGIGKKAVNATVKIEGGKPVVVPGKAGIGLDPADMAAKLAPVLTKTGDARAVEVESTIVQPQITTKDAEAWKITEKIGSFTTNYPHADYRNTNQSRAAELIDGTILEPGETFSFNTVVGERTVANGFVQGFVINGGVFREELGGGVSQVATTAYNAAFFAGLEDVEHHPHAFYISRYPVGREATIYYGSLDLRFKNPYTTEVLIQAWVDRSTPGRQGAMNVVMWGTKVYDVKAGQSAKRNFRNPVTRYDDTAACVPQDPVQGFDIDIFRTFYQDGKKVRSETNTARYQAADKVICGKKPDDD